MTMTRTPDPTAEALAAASARRQATRTDFIIPIPARRLPPRSRRHSVRHRAIR